MGYLTIVAVHHDYISFVYIYITCACSRRKDVLPSNKNDFALTLFQFYIILMLRFITTL